ncbi:MAG: 6-phosphogluconolactonase [Thermodesulfobacteriota bacterium]
MTHIHVCRDPQELYEQGAALYARLADEAVAARGRFMVALSGGSTPKGVHAVLAGDTYRTKIPWAHVQLFWGDERCVPPTHPESNYRMAEETLLAKVTIPARNVHRVPAELPPIEAADAYAQTLREVFALSGDAVPRFDLIFLGMGADGHTASLFPGTPGVREDRRPVIAQYVEKLQAWRVTLTPPVLNSAAQVVFLVSGADKAATLNAVLHGPFDPERFPAQLVRPTQGSVLWLVDQAAAGAVGEDEVMPSAAVGSRRPG